MSLFDDLGKLKNSYKVDRAGAFKNLIYSKNGKYFACSLGIELFVFDATSLALLNKVEYDKMGEFISLDVDNDGLVAATFIDHPTRSDRGFHIDKGIEDPRLIVVWDSFNDHSSDFIFDKELKIERLFFRIVLYGDPSRAMLVQVGRRVYDFELTN